MIKLVVLWNLPEGMSSEEFERRYFEEHVPLARAVPGVRGYLTTKFDAAPDGRAPAYYRMAEFYYDSEEVFRNGQSSPEAVTARQQVQDWGFRDVAFMLGTDAEQAPHPAGGDAA